MLLPIVFFTKNQQQNFVLPQEFLKKEFSAENILFWVSCERFRRSAESPSSTPESLHAGAIAILDRHLAQGAPDPVNVDSHARQAAQVCEGTF